MPTLEGRSYIDAARYAANINAVYAQVHNKVEKAIKNLFYDYNKFVSPAIFKDFNNRMGLDNALHVFNSTLEEMSVFNARLKSKLSKIANPTKIIWGENDLIIPLEHKTASLQIPNSHIEIMKEIGHNPYVENPIIFSEISLRFLTEQKIDLTKYKDNNKNYKRLHQCASCGCYTECPPDRCIYDNTPECKRFRVCEKRCHTYI